MVGGRPSPRALCILVAFAAGCSSGAGGGFGGPSPAPSATAPAALCGSSVVVSQPRIWGLQLAVDGGQVYYTAYGAGSDQHQHELWSAPVAGGEPTLVWQGASGFLGSGMRVADGRAFLSAELAWGGGGEGVMTVPVAGGQASVDATFGTPCAAYGGLAMDDSYVYAASNGCAAAGGQIVALPRAGGPAATLWSGSAPYVGASGLAVRAGEVYFLYDDDADGDGAVMKLAEGGAATPVRIGVDSEASGIAVDADAAYVTAGDALIRVPADGSPPSTLATRLAHPNLVAVDASGIYVVEGKLDDGPTGRILRVPRAGGAPTVLAEGQPAIFAIALDAQAVYWASQTGAFVARAGKCD